MQTNNLGYKAHVRQPNNYREVSMGKGKERNYVIRGLIAIAIRITPSMPMYLRHLWVQISNTY